MHASLEAVMGAKPALQPNSAIGPAVRAIALHVLTEARLAIVDPERSSQDAVHDFRRAMKEWRALMRLLAPFLDEAERWRLEARDYARSLAHARDRQAALNAFDDLVKKGMAVSDQSAATIRNRIEALRASEERAVLTPELREAILGWLDTVATAVEMWPLERFDFDAIAAGLTTGFRSARGYMPDDWVQASAEHLHKLRRRVVDHRYQMELIEPLWPRFARMWTDEAERLRDRLGKIQDVTVLERFTGPHQPLAPWRSRLTPSCIERRAQLSRRAARIGLRLFAERPKAFRHRLEMLWKRGS